LQILFDVVLLFSIMIAATTWLARAHGGGLESVVPYALLFAVVTTALNKMIGIYKTEALRSVTQISVLVMLSVLVTVPVAYAVFNELPKQAFANDELLQVAAVLAISVVILIRVLAGRPGSGLLRPCRVLVIGTGGEAEAVEQSLRGRDFEMVGFYPLRGTDTVIVPSRKVLTGDMSLAATSRKLMVDEIIVAVADRRAGGIPLNELLECKLAGIRVFDLSSYFERTLGQVRLESLRASWLIFGDGFRQDDMRTLVKRVFDIIVASALLVATLPIMLITGLFIALESGGPIFYRQDRVGFAGRVFRVTKFRSMRLDAECDGTPRWATSNDDRVTRVGQTIRKYRIDELPQLFNVLKGDMSLIGPRPERPFFVDKLAREIPFYSARHSIKPGLTGWAQVRYHYGASPDDAANKLQFDLYYVKNHTLFLDVIVLFETIMVVATGKGAR
jgi:sugar transferase (PEP-CTERM system associated)